MSETENVPCTSLALPHIPLPPLPPPTPAPPAPRPPPLLWHTEQSTGLHVF